jgi:hypothetical protein
MLLINCPSVLIWFLHTQVRLFLSEDAPCQSGLNTQDHLEAKDSWTGAGSTSDDSPVPPGFESVHNQNCPKTDISKISRILWKCPPKVLNIFFYLQESIWCQTDLCVVEFTSGKGLFLYASIIITFKSLWCVNYR